mmetsp:Transcript_81770/g.144335  ORF Transcript_81770/g.144335 Transcript_81770/m.144335 type:complete len:233 (+) Transcript_81770:589-1287(+)
MSQRHDPVLLTCPELRNLHPCPDGHLAACCLSVPAARKASATGSPRFLACHQDSLGSAATPHIPTPQCLNTAIALLADQISLAQRGRLNLQAPFAAAAPMLPSGSAAVAAEGAAAVASAAAADAATDRAALGSSAAAAAAFGTGPLAVATSLVGAVAAQEAADSNPMDALPHLNGQSCISLPARSALFARSGTSLSCGRRSLPEVHPLSVHRSSWHLGKHLSGSKPCKVWCK